MKKSIKIIEKYISNLNKGDDGRLQGGYASLKGGFNATSFGTNNYDQCTNITGCNPATNITTVCFNPGTCFI
jgi:hypothetical protein